MLTKNISKLIKNFSIEVMPRTLGKLENIENLWPKKTRVYIAHLEGTTIEDMLVTAKRIKSASFTPMPHFPARIIKDNKVLEDWINRYSEIGVNEALILAGGVDRPLGNLSNSMELLSTGLFEKYGFERLHVAGHPEGNKDIDPNGSDINVMNALKWKQDYSKDTNAKISIATQFLFESKPVIDWANKILSNGITLPINVGIAGPAKLQTMIKFAIAYGNQTWKTKAASFTPNPRIIATADTTRISGSISASVISAKSKLPTLRPIAKKPSNRTTAPTCVQNKNCKAILRLFPSP